MSVAFKIRRAVQKVKGAANVPLLKGEKVCSPAKTVREWAKKADRKIAISFEDRRITYGEFDREIDRYAKAAAAAGLRKGDVAAIVMENRPEYLFLSYGLNRLGVTAALINTNLVGKPLAHVLKASEAKILFVGAECYGHLESLGDDTPFKSDQVYVERSEAPDAKLPAGARDVLATADAAGDALRGLPLDEGIGNDWLCYIYTSGTTGLPKAGRCPNVRWYGGGYGLGATAVGCGPDDVIYVCLPLYHASAFMLGASFAFLHGGQMALARKFSASRFWDDVRKTEATVFLYIGELCRYLVAQPPRPDDKIHKLRAMSGNGMRSDVWRQFVERFGVDQVHEFYAATEGNANMVNMDGHVGAVGQLNLLTRLVYNTILVKWDPINEQPVRNEQGFCIECDVDEPGELLGKIDPKKVNTRFDGYADKQATEKKILRDVLEKGDSYFRTGDLLRRDAKGYYYFVDRIGDTYRWKGENVSTNEVADVLTMHPDIEVANVFGVEVPNTDGRAGMASINTPNNAEPNWKSVFDHVRANLAEYAQPLFLRWQKQADLTGTFKLRKVELQQEGFDPDKSPDPVYFRDIEAGTYVKVDAELHAKIVGSAVRI